MDQFWLSFITDDCFTLALVSADDQKYSVTQINSPQGLNKDDPGSLITTATTAIGETISSLSISPPAKIAFVVSPFWVDANGKIIDTKIKSIESICRSLKLKPMGSIAFDEAITEEANLHDGFPASFILLYSCQSEVVISLVYLGKITKRLHKFLTTPLDPPFLENCLLEFDSPSALPPQIIVFGDLPSNFIQDLKNYSWVGKKNIETFLHFPQINHYPDEKLFDIFSSLITAQMNPIITSKPAEPETLVKPVEEEESATSLEEVSSADLGFSVVEEKAFSPPLPPVLSPAPILPPSKPKLKLKFKIPHLRLKINFLLPLAFTPLLFLIPFYFSSATITLYTSPYSFSKDIAVTLDSSVQNLNVAKGTIPVTKKTFTISTTASIKTTGQKTVGDKARGDIIVFNKLDNPQTLPKGSILLDSSGKKFELINTASIASSSSNLDAGIINLGQTKAQVLALDIGPEYNLAKNTKLTFKDHPEISFVAKVSDGLIGGTKNSVNVVSQSDKDSLSSKINQDLNLAIDQKIKSEVSVLPGLIKETIQSKPGRIEYNREVGEEAADLEATLAADVLVFLIDPSKKAEIVNNFLKDLPDFSQTKIILDNFAFSFKDIQNKTDSSTAT
ncbi:MAG: hypothetical protein WC885_02275, partial [Candidatus Shapirobacteria bacterium]